jgi:hypothetical protein
MNKKFKWALGALFIALLAVGVFGTTSVLADDSGPDHPFGGRKGGRGLEGAALEAVADVLDMSTEDLSAALEEAQTLQDLAEDAGVDVQEVFDAMSAVREESMRERIAQAVEDDTMSQEKADWILEGLDKGFLNGPGFGFGPGGRCGDRFQKPDGEGSSAPDVNS